MARRVRNQREMEGDNEEHRAKAREAQDRAKDSEQARSPVDSMHVEAPNKQDNARGHAEDRARK